MRPTPEHARALRAAVPLFSALGDETRLRLVLRLAKDGGGSTADLCAAVEVTRQAVSKHLEILEDAKLVRSRRQGRERQWELAPERLQDAHDALDAIGARWDAALRRLQHFVER
jgi:DNA-binding transcriptional ArsR family regulator